MSGSTDVLTFLHAPDLGGVERVAMRLIRAWRERGLEAPLLLGRLGKSCSHSVGAIIPVLLSPRLEWMAARFETLWMICALPRMLRKLRPRLLFCAGNTYCVVAVVMKLLLGAKCPLILVKISNDLERRDMSAPMALAYRIWLRLQGLCIDHFIAVDAAMAAQIRKKMGIPPERISEITNPGLWRHQVEQICAQRPERKQETQGPRSFVTIGRLVRQKNLALMIRAFARGSDAHDRLTIYGDGPLRGELRRLAIWHGIGARVDFAGEVENPAMRLHEHDIFLLSSGYEGVPAAIVEALAANLTIISTNCSVSMPGLLEHGQLGTLVAPGDEDGFASAIRDARGGAQDPARTLEQAMRFTVEAASRSYAELFQALEIQSETMLESVA